MTDKPKPSALKPQSNADRLLKHLKADSLAQQLVKAHEGADSTDPIESARAVLLARLQQVRASFDSPKT